RLVLQVVERDGLRDAKLAGCNVGRLLQVLPVIGIEPTHGSIPDHQKSLDQVWILFGPLPHGEVHLPAARRDIDTTRLCRGNLAHPLLYVEGDSGCCCWMRTLRIETPSQKGRDRRNPSDIHESNVALRE